MAWISNPTPNAIQLSADAVAGRLEIVNESKNDTLLLQVRSDCDPDESLLPSGHDTTDLDASVRKVSALSEAEVAEK